MASDTGVVPLRTERIRRQRLLAISSSSFVFSHLGIGRSRSRLGPFETGRPLFAFILHLSSQVDGPGGFVAHLHPQAVFRGRDRQIPVAETSDEIEGLLETRVPTGPREHPERRFERAEPNQLWQSDIFTFLLRKHQRVYLLDVPDAFPPELLLEVCRATPRRVLAALVGEDLLRRAEGGDAVLEGFHDEAAFLVMRQGVPDDEARVVVHEGGQVHTLMLAKKKREDVRLPELVGLGSLESTLGMLPGPRRHPGFEKPFWAP